MGGNLGGSLKPVQDVAGERNAMCWPLDSSLYGAQSPDKREQSHFNGLSGSGKKIVSFVLRHLSLCPCILEKQDNSVA